MEEVALGVLERYQAYVDAFEQSVADDDWSRIGPFFTEDAVLIYEDETVAREQIARLRDVSDQAMQQWIADHGAALRGG